MTERDIAITVIVLLCVASVLTTPFMLIKRGGGKREPIQRTWWQKALLVASNVTLVVLMAWLGWYLWQAW